MDNFFVVIIVFFAAIYLFRKFYSVFKKKDTVCGCDACDLKSKANPCACRKKPDQ